MQAKTILLAAILSAAPGLLHAQFDFKLDGRDIQVHSFAQQGFAFSNNNNFLTMNTSNGTFAMTDGGVNASTSITDHFRVGAQAYVRNIGQLGDYHVQLDWAYGDYKFKPWFGVRAGKVKTALGLFNDTQDAEFLYTWAILPQSIYPLDLRANTIAHVGADVYGQIDMHKAGGLNYTAYYGTRTNDTRGGFYYDAADTGDPIKNFSGKTRGADLRWNTPVSGLMLGGSWAGETADVDGAIVRYGDLRYSLSAQPQHLTAGYGDYTRGRWHFSGEYRRNREILKILALGNTSFSNRSEKEWFLTAAYRVTKRLELGTYHSRYNVDAPTSTNPAANHIFDQTVTARFDLTRWLNVKVEEHFMDGYGDIYSAHGFYLRDNTSTKPKTDMFVIRMGYNM